MKCRWPYRLNDHEDPDANFISYSDAEPNQYVVTFAENAYTPPPPDDQQPSLAQATVDQEDAEDLTNDVCDDYMATPIATLPYVGGFGCTMTETQARAMSHDARVASVESNALAYTTGVLSDDGRSNTDPDPVGWALDRVTQPYLPLDGLFGETYSGINVNVYMVDSGIWLGNPEFHDAAGNPHAFGEFPYGSGSGQYIPGMTKYNGAPDYDSDDDLGHGTGTASVACGKTCGLGRGTALHAVKVIDWHDRSNELWVAMGLDFVDHAAPSFQPAVVNMSLELHIDPTMKNRGKLMEAAINRLLSRKITVVVASGNDGSDAAHVIPAGFAQVITVGGSQISDRTPGLTSAVESIADYQFANIAGVVGSNYGSLVDVFAPSVGVHANTFNRDQYLNTGNRASISSYDNLGTSVATPLVTGAVAQYLQ